MDAFVNEDITITVNQHKTADKSGSIYLLLPEWVKPILKLYLNIIRPLLRELGLFSSTDAEGADEESASESDQGQVVKVKRVQLKDLLLPRGCLTVFLRHVLPAVSHSLSYSGLITLLA